MLAAVVLLYSVAALSIIIFKGQAHAMNASLIAFVTMLLVLQWVVAVRAQPSAALEKYVDASDNLEDVGLEDMPRGLVLYVSGFITSSYSGYGKHFRNVAITDNFVSPDIEKNFYFRVDPAFSRRDGCSMNSNSLTGPLSFQMDIKGDLAFSTVMVCQFIGITSGNNDVILQRIYANTPDNNGFCIFMKNFTSLSGNVISADMFVTFGTSSPFRCSQSSATPGPILLDTHKKYMIVVSKGMGDLKVTLVDVGVHTTYDSQVILDAKLTLRESVVFSNREMRINNNENWNANMMSFGIFDRMLADTDIHDMYSHYTSIFRKMDPEYKAIFNSLKEVTKARQCPFDASTCAACASVSDFTNPKLVMASSDLCLRSINSYCTNNPSHSACWCWDTQNPYYATRCKPYRALFVPQVQPVDDVEEPEEPEVEPPVEENSTTMDELMKFIATDKIPDANGNSSLLNSLFNVLHKPGVGDALTDVFKKVVGPAIPVDAGPAVIAPSKDAVQAMLTVLADLKNNVPSNTAQAAAALNFSQLVSSQEVTPLTPTTLTSAPPTSTPTLKPLPTQAPVLKLPSSEEAPSLKFLPSRAPSEQPSKFSMIKWFFGMKQ